MSGGPPNGTAAVPPGPPPGVPERRRGRRLGSWARRASLLIAAGFVLLGLSVALLLVWYFTFRSDESEPAPVTGELAVGAGTRSATLYFAAASGDSLVRETRQLVETGSVTNNVRTLIEELVRGPRADRAKPVLPAGAEVQHVFFDESGQVIVDFTPQLRSGFAGGSAAEYLMLAALVRTLTTNLPTVTAVTLTVNGRPIDSLGGHFPLALPLSVSEWR